MKKIYYWLPLSLLLVAAVFFAIVWFGVFNKNKITLPGNLSSKERQLGSEQVKIYNDRIAKALLDLKQLNPADVSLKNQRLNDYIYLAEQYFGLGMLENSKEAYLSALEIDSKNEAALSGISYLYADAGKWGDAIASLQTALDSSPVNETLWLQLIDVQKSAGLDSLEINKLYEIALEKARQKINLLTRYAQYQESQGNIVKAIELWQEAAKVYPENTSLYNQEITRLTAKLKK